MQIEQVKKKRGRKKKWEVETTTKLIDNCPISFSEGSNKLETKEVDSNYEATSILFGNLNIKVHTNKDQNQVEDIKDSLFKNNNSNNNSIQNKESRCKIDLTNSDFDDSDDNNDNINNNYDKFESSITNLNKKNKKEKYNRKKLPKIEKNIKVMKFFKDEFDNGNEIIMSKIRCYNCHHNFNNKPFFLPIDYDAHIERFKVTGNFCSPNCVKSFSMNSKNLYQKTYLVGFMYRKLFGPYYNIKPAPPIQVLKEYGGKLSIEEFRATFDNNKSYKLKSICSKVIMDEILEN